MYSFGSPRRHLAAVLLLTGIVLAGRVALALHPYEHGIAELPAECEFCACCQLFGDGLLATVATSPEAPGAERVLLVLRGPVLAFRRGTRLPRAPPVKLV